MILYEVLLYCYDYHYELLTIFMDINFRLFKQL